MARWLGAAVEASVRRACWAAKGGLVVSGQSDVGCCSGVWEDGRVRLARLHDEELCGVQAVYDLHGGPAGLFQELDEPEFCPPQAVGQAVGQAADPGPASDAMGEGEAAFSKYWPPEVGGADEAVLAGHLYAAIALQDIETLQHICERGVSLGSVRDSAGRPPLAAAVAGRSGLEVVRVLLRFGADPAATDAAGRNTLALCLLDQSELQGGRSAAAVRVDEMEEWAVSGPQDVSSAVDTEALLNGPGPGPGGCHDDRDIGRFRGDLALSLVVCCQAELGDVEWALLSSCPSQELRAAFAAWVGLDDEGR